MASERPCSPDTFRPTAMCAWPHRCPHHQTQVIDLQPVVNQQIVCPHHVVVPVVGETGVETVARFARLAVSNTIRKNDEILRRVQRLAGPEKLASEALAQKTGAAAAGPCMMRTALLTWPEASRTGLRS